MEIIVKRHITIGKDDVEVGYNINNSTLIATMACHLSDLFPSLTQKEIENELLNMNKKLSRKFKLADNRIQDGIAYCVYVIPKNNKSRTEIRKLHFVFNKLFKKSLKNLKEKEDDRNIQNWIIPEMEMKFLL